MFGSILNSTPPLHERYERYLEELLEDLSRRCKKGYISTLHRSRARLPGDFRSNFLTLKAPEIAEPRPFSLDDDIETLDMGRMSRSILWSLPLAVAENSLRVIQSRLFTESEFIIVIDLSRSMLAGSLPKGGKKSLEKPRIEIKKIESIYYAVTNFLSVAESARFVLRVIYINGGKFEQERYRNAKDYAQRALAIMNQGLKRTYNATEKDPASIEDYAMGPALQSIFPVKVKSLVVVISDFLDPFDRYSSALAEVMTRHNTMLIDVASREDRDFPIPDSYAREAQKVKVREGARRMVEGT